MIGMPHAWGVGAGLAIAAWGTAAGEAECQETFRADRVAGGARSEEAADAFPTPSADGLELYFSRQKPGAGWGEQTLMVARWTADGWSAAEPLPFSDGEASDRAPRLSPDGRLLFFSSDRPRPGDPEVQAFGFDLWVSERADGGWSEPRRLPEPVNSAGHEIHPSVTSDGTLYFASNRDEGGLGRSDLHRARHGPGGWSVENLGVPTNSERSEPDLWISPDGSWMILVITEHPDGFGGDDLYVSRLEADGWSAPVNLGPAVNTPEYEYGPAVSADGEWLWFTSHRTGEGDIYRVRVTEVEALAP